MTLNDGCILGARGVAKKKIWMLGMYMMGIRVKKIKKKGDGK
ncbi:hypothetical protein [Escherichia coli]|nr:hypothetical protein [Escherichia coli]